MAAESNAEFHHYEETLGAVLNRHAMSFQLGAINRTSEMIPMGNYFGVNSTSSGGMIFPGNSNIFSINPAILQAANSSGSFLLDSPPGLKNDAGFSAEWSVEEQYKLEEGLVNFGDEPSIMRYIKIAAMLHNKTVRDVALRCRWMTRKRRKPEEHNPGKKLNNRKDKLVESSPNMNVPLSLPLNMAVYPHMVHHRIQNECMPGDGISGTSKHLLQQNAQAFNQISANLSTYKLEDNIDLFCCTRNNIAAILNDMRDMPGIMSQMPPLPVSINENLANSILPNANQLLMFGFD